ncbi:MAG: icmD [Gammaproteobacteria bacterium]|nr:icmD [Gammaproteobacteria bacterium]
MRSLHWVLNIFLTLILMLLSQTCFAVSLGDIANNLLEPTRGITQLMYGVSYVAGAGMIIMALTQYKAHRDNPSQVRLGTPIAFFIFGVVFLMIPALSQHSASSVYVSQKEILDRAKANAPLQYGEPKRPTREGAQQPARSQPSSMPSPVDAQDSDWYQ